MKQGNDSPDRPALRRASSGCGVEITDEMVSDGMYALSRFDRDDPESEIVRAVFLAMLHASKCQPLRKAQRAFR